MATNEERERTEDNDEDKKAIVTDTEEGEEDQEDVQELDSQEGSAEDDPPATTKKRKWEVLEEELKKQEKDVKKRVEKLEKREEDVKTRVEKLEKRLEKIEEKLEKTEDNLRRKAEELKRKEEQWNLREDRDTSIAEKEQAELKQQQAELKQQQAVLQQQQAVLQQQQVELQREQTELQREQTELQREQTELQKQQTALTQKVVVTEEILQAPAMRFMGDVGPVSLPFGIVSLFRINILEPAGTTLMKIPCLESGKTFDLVRLFLTTAFENFDVNKYAMITESNNRIDLATTDPMLVIHPGEYFLNLKDGTALHLQKRTYIPIIPSSKNNSRRSSIGETKTIEPTRIASFRECLIRRDHCCVISQWQDLQYLKASHIIAFSYWREQNRGDLPFSIFCIIQGLPDQINDVQNGMLLSSTLSEAFDRGDIAFRKSDGDHCVVSINPHFSLYEGKKLKRNSSGGMHLPPHPELLQFHLQLSVLKNMCAAGEDYSDDDEDDEKMQDIMQDILPVPQIEVY